MIFDTKFYVIAAIVVVILTALSSVAVGISGARSPGTKIGEIWPKVLTGIIITGIVISALLGFKAFQVRGDPSDDSTPKKDDVVVSEEFDYEEYLIKHKNDLSIELEYGEEFNPQYDSTLLTLVTEDIEIKGKAGFEKVSLLFEDKEGNFHTLQYEITIVDYDFPELEGVRDVHVDYGKPFSAESLGITATDPVDGPLEVELKGNVDTDKEGIYAVTARAEDLNQNAVGEEFFVVVGGRNEENVFNPSDGELGDDDMLSPDEIPEAGEELLPLTEIAKEVIGGKYGVGVRRQYYLAKNGYNYQEVQNEVNRLLANGYKIPEGAFDVKGVDLSEVNNVSQESSGNNDDFWYDTSDLDESLVSSSFSEENKKEKRLEVEEIKEVEGIKEVEKVKEEFTIEASNELLEIDNIAKQVIRGDYGNGQERYNKLTSLGYDYNTVQAKVQSYKGILY